MVNPKPETEETTMPATTLMTCPTPDTPTGRDVPGEGQSPRAMPAVRISPAATAASIGDAPRPGDLVSKPGAAEARPGFWEALRRSLGALTV